LLCHNVLAIVEHQHKQSGNYTDQFKSSNTLLASILGIIDNQEFCSEKY